MRTVIYRLLPDKNNSGTLPANAAFAQLQDKSNGKVWQAEKGNAKDLQHHNHQRSSFILNVLDKSTEVCRRYSV